MSVAGPSKLDGTLLRQVEVDHLGMFDVAHALVVADGQVRKDTIIMRPSITLRSNSSSG